MQDMNIPELIVLGFTLALAPGPVLALLFGETLKHGRKVGIRVPLALLISNVFFAAVTIPIGLLGSSLSPHFLEIINHIGGAILLYMGIQEWKNSGHLAFSTSSKPFIKALTLESFNAHPYITWFTILAPNMLKPIHAHNYVLSLKFFCAFVFSLVLTKIALVFFIDLIKPYLKPHHVRIITKIIALFLLVLGLNLLIS